MAIQMQKTLRTSASIQGTSLHTGQPVKLTIKPAEVNTGLKFRRIDLPDKPFIDASAANVQTVERATTLAEGSVNVHTVEHILSALTGMGVDHASIEMDANEPGHAAWLDGLSMELPFYGIGEFMRKNEWGSIVLDLRASVDINHFTISFVVNNLLNAEYSLRPLYIEAPRTYTLQMVYRFQDINPVTWFRRSKADVARL